MSPSLIDVIYLVSSVLMLAGVWQFLQHGRAGRGNLLGGAGLALALLATLTASGGVPPGAAVAGLIVGAGMGAFVGMRVTPETGLAWLAVLLSGIGLSVALVAGVNIHDVGELYDAAIAVLNLKWEGVPDDVRRANQEELPTIPVLWPSIAAAAIAATFGGAICSAAAICWLKLSRSPLRKALPKLDDPRMPQLGLVVVCLVLSLLLIGWPGTETFLWLLLICALALGYVLTIHLKIVDVPPVLAALVAAMGLALASAGILIGNLLMVTAGALVASGGGVVSLALCKELNVSLVGLLRGSETSKGGAVEEVEGPSTLTEPGPPPPPRTTTASPDAPMI
jgi:H+-translocating NAD(P) transhydrogenase subunit beta